MDMLALKKPSGEDSLGSLLSARSSARSGPRKPVQDLGEILKVRIDLN